MNDYVHTYVAAKIERKVVWHDPQAVFPAHFKDQVSTRDAVGVGAGDLLGVVQGDLPAPVDCASTKAIAIRIHSETVLTTETEMLP